MCSSSPKAPDPPPPPAAPPSRVDEGVTQSRSDEMRRRRAATGFNSTLRTGVGGLGDTASTSGNQLLGQ